MFLFIVILFIIINSYFSYLTHLNGTSFYDQRIKEKKIIPKVFDIGHKYLPNLTDNIHLLSIINFSAVLTPFIVHFLMGYDILPEFMYYFAIVYLIRIITINSTILPKQKMCMDEFNFKSMFNGHCYDKIFSGHFASIFLLVLMVYKKNIFTNIPFLGIYLIINALSILMTRSHYTIDIIIASIVVMFVYFNIPYKFKKN